MKEPIKLYGTQMCPQCQGAKQYLTANEVPFEYIDVNNDQEGLRHLEDLGVYTLPVIEHGKDIIVGFDAVKITEMIREVM